VLTHNVYSETAREKTDIWVNNEKPVVVSRSEGIRNGSRIWCVGETSLSICKATEYLVGIGG
jgi:hypothetical protein